MWGSVQKVGLTETAFQAQDPPATGRARLQTSICLFLSHQVPRPLFSVKPKNKLTPHKTFISRTSLVYFSQTLPHTFKTYLRLVSVPKIRDIWFH